MAKRITKAINSQYLPTYVGGYPIYGCGGRMKKYASGGFGDFMQTNANPLGALGGMAGSTIEQFGDPSKPGYGANIGGGALKGAAAGAALGPIGALVGGGIGAVSGWLKSNQQKDMLEAQERAAVQRQNQQLASNLPATVGYKPTFAGGGLLNSLATNYNPDNTTEYANGGSHQSNPYGGIPIGQDALVEEGEVRFDTDGGESYIFSNRIPYNKK